MRIIKRTTQFKRDYKLQKRGRHKLTLEDDLLKAIKLLITDAKLPERMYDHTLAGNWKNHRDCHIKPNLVLIYRKTEDNVLELIRLGSHSELGF
jgi:mRNA interferase YafQ